MSLFAGRRAFIFDMDGVLVDSAHFHFLSWTGIAERYNIPFGESQNENLKGISRVESLEYILSLKPELQLSPEVKQKLLVEKNDIYLESINQMNENSLLSGMEGVLNHLQAMGYPLAIGSSSKNARHIVKLVSMDRWMQAIADGTDITRSKPDPQVFLLAAEGLGIDPMECVVIEDSASGVTGANTAGMLSIGIGDEKLLGHADLVVPDTKSLEILIKKEINEAIS